MLKTKPIPHQIQTKQLHILQFLLIFAIYTVFYPDQLSKYLSKYQLFNVILLENGASSKKSLLHVFDFFFIKDLQF